MVLVSVNDEGVTKSTVVVISGDKCVDEICVLSMSRERILDVTEFIVVSVSIDDRASDDMVLLRADIYVRSLFPEVVNSVDNLGTLFEVINIRSLFEDIDDSVGNCVGEFVDEYV